MNYKMNYEKVQRAEKLVVGISTRTSNDAPDCSAKIGGLWKEFYETTFGKIAGKVGEAPVCLYSNVWASDRSYLTTVGVYAEANAVGGINAGLTGIAIPAGEYAKFCFHGNMITACIAAWETLAKENLDMLVNMEFSFEEYHCPSGDMDNCDIDIYIKVR
jgi:predicted transcriptional regulator YdeE